MERISRSKLEKLGFELQFGSTCVYLLDSSKNCNDSIFDVWLETSQDEQLQTKELQFHHFDSGADLFFEVKNEKHLKELISEKSLNSVYKAFEQDIFKLNQTFYKNEH